MKTKSEVIQEIVKIQYPFNKWKRSLEASSIERCNYSKKELMDILNNFKKEMSKKLFEQQQEKNLLNPTKNGYDEMDISEWWDYMEQKSIEQYEEVCKHND